MPRKIGGEPPSRMTPELWEELREFERQQKEAIAASIIIYIVYFPFLGGVIGFVVHLALWNSVSLPTEEETRKPPLTPFFPMDTSDVAANADWKDPGPRPVEISAVIEKYNEMWMLLLSIYLLIFITFLFVAIVLLASLGLLIFILGWY